MILCNLGLFLLLAFVLVPSAYGLALNTCVTSFKEFEKAAIANVSNVEALVNAFYRANSPFPQSVQVVYHVNSSNGTDTIISTDPKCPSGEEVWLWVPSLVFIFTEPTKLNRYALYTLNYFSDLYNTPTSQHICTIYLQHKSQSFQLPQ